MKIKKAIEILKAHNNWRRGHIEEMCLTPKEIGEAIDTVVSFYESPPAESEKIPEILKGTEYNYMMQIKDLIKNQHTMTPDWVIAHAMSIVCYAYSAGVDFVVDTLKLETGRKEESKWQLK